MSGKRDPTVGYAEGRGFPKEIEKTKEKNETTRKSGMMVPASVNRRVAIAFVEGDLESKSFVGETIVAWCIEQPLQ